MLRMDRLPSMLLILGLLATGPMSARASEEFAFFHENVLGTSMELRLLADSPEAARRAEDRVLAEIDRLARIFSTYDPGSELRRWQDGPPKASRISAELREMFEASDRWTACSGGAFDARVEVMSRLWRRSSRAGREPSPAEISGAAALMSRPAWRLGPGPLDVERLSDCPFSFNAIAKGHIVEQSNRAGLRPEQGVHGILLNLGGDLRVDGKLTHTLGIAAPWADSETAEPITMIKVKDRAVATSGASQRGFQINGKWYSHILDPRTGQPVERIASATVIARDSTDADALATIANVLEPAATLRLVAEVPDAECLIVTSDGRIKHSPGWSRYEAPRSLEHRQLLSVALGPDQPENSQSPEVRAAWGHEFELIVNFEINSPEGEGRRYRRPYIAIWIEDKNGQPVRTLSLWVSMGGAGPFQWIPDLKRWYKADQLRKQRDNSELVFTISRPTRPPGKYRAVWDGKDDQGKPVPPGEYSVLIDAAREHGTYQNLRKVVTVGGEPFSAELEGGVEIKAASIEYRKRRPPARAAQR